MKMLGAFIIFIVGSAFVFWIVVSFIQLIYMT